MLPWLRATDLGFVTAIGVGDLLGLGHRYQSQYHKSLLILDDVWSSQIIKSFDVCAKVLVTTQDITVLDNISKKNVTVVKMKGGFSQEESLQVS